MIQYYFYGEFMTVDPKRNVGQVEDTINNENLSSSTRVSQESLFVGSSIKSVKQNLNDSSRSKGCWESFKDCIKLIYDRIVEVLNRLFSRPMQRVHDQISKDGQYTTLGFAELRIQGGINRDILNSIDFQQIYPGNFSKGSYPIILPRLDFIQSTNYSNDEIEWIKSFITQCIGFERRPPLGVPERLFLEKHIYAYVDLIMKTNNRSIVINDIIELVKSKTPTSGSAGKNFGVDFIHALDDLNRSESSNYFKEFYNLIYLQLEKHISQYNYI